jgi:hypothetical protein
VTISVSPAQVTRLLTFVVGALAAAGLASVALKHAIGGESVWRVVHLFNLDVEGTIASWYSSCALLGAAGVLGLIAHAERERASRDWRYWAGLAVIFVALSADEAASIHELAIRPMRRALNLSGLLAFGWVIPGAAFVAIAGAIFLRFLLRLPLSTRRLFVIAGGLYVGGALGFEMLGGLLWTKYGMGLATALEAVAEEALEMAGIVVFLHALLQHLGRIAGSVSFRIEPAA